ncbi:MAG: 7-carboxy-7-deazaguanine synthase QueE [Planctomycetota bacterium]
MNISEIFYSIQGEGKLAGIPSAFVRTTGCNLRCTWCDTPYTSWSPEGEDMSMDEIVERLSDFPTRYAVLTGGEPLIVDGVSELTRRIKDGGYHLTIETAATVFADVACDLMSISPKLGNSTPWERDDGRFADAHECNRLRIDVIRRLMNLGPKPPTPDSKPGTQVETRAPDRSAQIETPLPQGGRGQGEEGLRSTAGDYQLKFVVDAPEDIHEIDDLLARLGHYDPSDVLLMPQGTTTAELDARGPWVAEWCKKRGFRYCPRLHIDLFGHTRGT